MDDAARTIGELAERAPACPHYDPAPWRELARLADAPGADARGLAVDALALFVAQGGDAPADAR